MSKFSTFWCRHNSWYAIACRTWRMSVKLRLLIFIDCSTRHRDHNRTRSRWVRPLLPQESNSSFIIAFVKLHGVGGGRDRSYLFSGIKSSYLPKQSLFRIFLVRWRSPVTVLTALNYPWCKRAMRSVAPTRRESDKSSASISAIYTAITVTPRRYGNGKS